ncbi:hypothetical protein P43SY_000018 [Pythium insidiosum]|uniref:Carbonic anhydrase n=1 Tax=Pythium insidiosum TaxID=114742 RepID=A0AAD5QBW0_PYTIN|nr:hypothetical protein P43SY_000018 [Pythium insidiosum]
MEEVVDMKTALEKDIEQLQAEAQAVEAQLRQLMLPSTSAVSSTAVSDGLNMATITKKRRLNEEFDSYVEQIERKRSELRNLEKTMNSLRQRRDEKERLKDSMVWTPLRSLLVASGLVAAVQAGDPWGYSEKSTEYLPPSRWSELNPNCGGTHQSPINLEYEGPDIINRWNTTHGVVPLKFVGDCRNFNLRTLDDLFKWEFNGDSACKVKLQLEGGKTYTLAQYHIHSRSEHTIYRHHYSGEVHFVHKEDGGSGLLVTGLLLHAREGAAESAWVEDVWRTMNEGKEGEPVPVTMQL